MQTKTQKVCRKQKNNHKIKNDKRFCQNDSPFVKKQMYVCSFVHMTKTAVF